MQKRFYRRERRERKVAQRFLTGGGAPVDFGSVGEDCGETLATRLDASAGFDKNEREVGQMGRVKLPGQSMRRVIIFIWRGFMGLSCLLASCCYGKPNGVDANALADFEWFNGLGFPDVKGSTLVRVATGQWSQRGDEPRQNRYEKGFLLATNGNVFTILSLSLSKPTFTNSSLGKLEHERVGFEVLKLDTEASALGKALQQRQGRNDLWPRFGEQTTERVEIFTLAWGCWRQGLEAEAQLLYELAKTLPTGRSGHNEEPTFRQSVEKDLGHTMMWRAVLDFEDVSISRHQLLDEFEKIVKNYPHSEHRERARKTAEVLKRMIAEDQAHKPLTPTLSPSDGAREKKANTSAVMYNELVRLPVEEQVRELIFQLREQNGHQYSQPGSCDIFADWGRTTNTPAHRLVALGYAAVPQLIAALDSDALSRSVGYHRNFYFSHTVLTVGDCAAQILQRITGRSFFVEKSTYSYMSEEGEMSATRRAAEDWWAGVQAKGEKQMLMQAIAAAGRDAPAQAELLSRKYPDVATTTLIRGARATTNSWVRAALVEQIANLSEAPGLEFLRVEVLRGPTLQSRVAAAYGLRWHKETVAVSAMMREWEGLRAKGHENEGGWDQVVQFLASCDSVEAISALGKNLRQRRPDVKLEVIDALGKTNGWFFSRHQTDVASMPTLEAIEKTLVAALEDTEERNGMSGTQYGQSFSDPRICDMAGCVLALRWPARYNTIDLSAPLKERDRQRIECMNAWRKAHNLPPLPPPQARLVRVGRNEATKVTAIEWSPDSQKPHSSFASRVASFNGRLLDPKELVLLFSNFARRSEPGAAGLEFKAIKDDDLTGVRMFVKLIPGGNPTEGQGWNISERVILGRNALHGQHGGGTLEAYAGASQWADFGEAVKQVIAGAPETPFEISVRLWRANQTGDYE